MTIKIAQTFYEPVPTGRYVARISEIEEADGQYGPQLKFSFDLPPDEEGQPRSLIGWTSQRFSPKSKLYGWVKAAFGGGVIDRQYTFNSDELIGKKVFLTVVEKTGDNGIFNKIEDVTPYIPQTQQIPAQTQPDTSTDW